MVDVDAQAGAADVRADVFDGPLIGVLVGGVLGEVFACAPASAIPLVTPGASVAVFFGGVDRIRDPIVDVCLAKPAQRHPDACQLLKWDQRKALHAPSVRPAFP